MIELLYSGECPYCRAVARFVNAVDVGGEIKTTPIESERGHELVENHHGEYVHAPHLFTDDIVYYGVKPVVKGMVRHVPKEYLSSERSVKHDVR